jgi:hypothetical protein
MRAYPGSCGRFILGSHTPDRNVPSRLCNNLKPSDKPFCEACCNYVRFAMHNAIPDRMVREINATHAETLN